MNFDSLSVGVLNQNYTPAVELHQKDVSRSLSMSTRSSIGQLLPDTKALLTHLQTPRTNQNTKWSYSIVRWPTLGKEVVK